MKHFSQFLFLVLFLSKLSAQTTSTFESASLPDSSYWNGSDGSATGFESGNAWFPTVWDTSFGGYWSSGFALSTMHDTVTAGFTNQYSAITGSGENGSAGYGVNYNDGYFLLTGSAKGQSLQGAFITNSTYSFLSMKSGDAFAKKFGGENGSDPDFFCIVFKGYENNVENEDSVVFYLADFRSENSNEDYIIKDWTWVDLSSLGEVDSVAFYFMSSDVGSFGINTPKYFCIDNLITNEEEPNGMASIQSVNSLKIYPNPSAGLIHINNAVQGNVEVFNLRGELLLNTTLSRTQNTLDLSYLPNGIYLVRNGSSCQKLILSRP